MRLRLDVDLGAEYLEYESCPRPPCGLPSTESLDVCLMCALNHPEVALPVRKMCVRKWPGIALLLIAF